MDVEGRLGEGGEELGRTRVNPDPLDRGELGQTDAPWN
jgi:hypothetical protein